MYWRVVDHWSSPKINCLKIPTWQPAMHFETGQYNNQNTITTKWHTTVDKTLHRILKIEQLKTAQIIEWV
jgi:hypothetical protein